jgi:hypothetical protein
VAVDVAGDVVVGVGVEEVEVAVGVVEVVVGVDATVER